MEGESCGCDSRVTERKIGQYKIFWHRSRAKKIGKSLCEMAGEEGGFRGSGYVYT